MNYHKCFLLAIICFALAEIIYCFTQLSLNDLEIITPKIEKEIAVIKEKENLPILQEIPKGQKITVIITYYSELDSCHYRNPERKCLTANRKEIKKGMIACNSKYPFGTQFLIDGLIYTCEDRYNENLDLERKIETLDVWLGYGMQNYLLASQKGTQKMVVEIIK